MEGPQSLETGYGGIRGRVGVMRKGCGEGGRMPEAPLPPTALFWHEFTIGNNINSSDSFIRKVWERWGL